MLDYICKLVCRQEDDCSHLLCNHKFHKICLMETKVACNQSGMDLVCPVCLQSARDIFTENSNGERPIVDGCVFSDVEGLDGSLQGGGSDPGVASAVAEVVAPCVVA